MRTCYLAVFYLCLAMPVFGRDVGQTAPRMNAAKLPAYCVGRHSVGKLGLMVNNGAAVSWWPPLIGDTGQCILGGEFEMNGEYPRGEKIAYLDRAGIWIGAVVLGDTLVSCALAPEDYQLAEFYPDAEPFGRMIERSMYSSDTTYGPGVSEQDFLATCTDTLTTGLPGLIPDVQSLRAHKPLPVRVDQASYGWSSSVADDFVLLNYVITNLGAQRLDDVYVGFYMSVGVGYFKDPGQPGASDDLTGFLPDYPAANSCGYIDTLNLAWSADNDGDPVSGSYVINPEQKSCTAVSGVRLLTPLQNDQKLSYNWWAWDGIGYVDFGPRRRPTETEPWRDFHTGGTGVPKGDANKYYLMRSGEIDYDQAVTASISAINPVWSSVPENLKTELSDGYYVYYLLSAGPFNLDPGEQLPLTYAYVAGEGFHTDPDNLKRLRAGDVLGYYQHVSFADLARNAMWAEHTYDNPGVDTDGDGYAGEYRVCVRDSVLVDGKWVYNLADTSWYKGDGVPDFRAAMPPPQPIYWLTPTLNGIHIRFNGAASERTKDNFTNSIDFEGYHIYLGRDDREASFSLVGGWDRRDYDKHVWVPSGSGARWVVQEVPFTLETLRCLYGYGSDKCADTAFDPLAYTAANPYRDKRFVDSVFYFTAHDFNTTDFGVTTTITKCFPDEPMPPAYGDIAASAYTPDGFLKYYEYECTISNLLPTVQYYVNVTAFDFGFPQTQTPALENPKSVGWKTAYTLADSAQLAGLQPVYVYPNPYRTDAHYRDNGFEGRGDGRIDDRLRLIHFVNVPASCIIRIYTVDGDLVRAIKHQYDPSDPNSHHETWDMINRNIQTVVSGLYYWTVEGSDGKVQIGKLVIIR